MTDRSVAVVVHGHFYQPPRENPWTDTVDKEPGAEPFHDWNERIFHECYRANAYARVLDDEGRIERIVNNFLHLNFNLGPTLLSWLKRHHLISYGRIVEADALSAKRRGGHGNAMAQGYNHCILPLCSERDRRTQIRWGVQDFQHHFSRDPEGFWLPETAANHEVLDTLVEEGLRFTILSPYQAGEMRRLGDNDWEDASGGRVDPTQAYRYLHSDGSGRGIDIIFYDGPLSKGIAFEGALDTSQSFLDTLAHGRGQGPLINVATDGESYGHHFKFGDRTIAHALDVAADHRDLWVTNFGEFLDHHPPQHEVKLWLGPDGRGSSWSCAHGVGRWFTDCGCQTGGQAGWNQAWRQPLRAALDGLREEAARILDEQGPKFFKDPWVARDAYAQVMLSEDPEAFFEAQACRKLSASDRVEALSLMEMQRHAMLMYTSCGWFFSDLAGIETQQLLKYAGRTIDFMREAGHKGTLDTFLERLNEAKSNLPEEGNGADIYRRHVVPVRVSPRRLAAHIAISNLAHETKSEGQLAGYEYQCSNVKTQGHGRIRLSTGRVHLTQAATGRPHVESLAALHLGGVDFYCVVRNDLTEGEFQAATERVWSEFQTASLPKLLRLAAQEFSQKEYGLEHLLPGGAQGVAEQIMSGLVKRFSEQYAHLYEDHRRTLEMLRSAGVHLPNEFRAAAELTLARRFEQEIASQHESRNPEAYRRAISIADHARSQGYTLDPGVASRTFESMLNHSAIVAMARPCEESLNSTLEVLELIERLRLNVNFERAQEAIYGAALSKTDLPPAQMNKLLRALKFSDNIRIPE